MSTITADPDQLHAAGAELYARGFNVVGIVRHKKTVAAWKELQSRRQTSAELAMHIDWPELQGIGVICGCDWNGLGVRDYDDEGSARAWAAKYPSLARELPRVRTHRGEQIWFKSPPFKTIPFEDGELRGKKHIAIAPPSRHDKGHVYHWINPLRDRLPEVDPAVFYSASNDSVTPQPLQDDVRCYRETEDTEIQKQSSLSLCNTVIELPDEAQNAVLQSLPSVEGQRHRKLFELARRLRALPDFAQVNVTACQAVVRQWHNRALPVIGTKDWDETWGEFIIAWPNVKTAFGAGTVDQALERARVADFPADLDSAYESENARLLLKLCREMQRDTDPAPFFLSCKTVEHLLNIDRMTAWRYLRRMVAEGVLQVVEVNTKSRATRYRYVE